MGDLHQVVYLGAAADAGSLERCAVDGAVGADLHVVFDHHDADLRDLVVRGSVRRVAEAVRADHGAVVDGHAVADPASLPDAHVGVQRHVVADHHAGVEHDPRVQDDPVAQGHPGSDAGARVNGDIRADLDTLGDEGSVHDSPGRGGRRVEQGQELREGEVGVGMEDGVLAVRVAAGPEEHRGRLGCGDLAGVLGVGEEGELPVPGVVQRGQTADQDLAVAGDRAPEIDGYFLKRFFHHESLKTVLCSTF